MFRTLTRIAALAAVTVAVAPVSGAQAQYKLTNVLVSSVQPDGGTALLPAVQSARDIAR